MKVLQVCKKFPYPLKDGESIAVTHLSKALHQLGCEVDLLSMNTSKHYCDLHTIPKSYNQYKAIHTVDVDNRLKPWAAFWNLFSPHSYHVTRFISKAFQQKLVALLQNNQYDIIQLETVYLAPYIDCIRSYSDAKIVMRAHNIEHEIWERVAENHKILPLKMYLKFITRKLKRFEINSLQQYDMLVAITTRDLELYRKLGFQKAQMVTPVGIDGATYSPAYRSFQSFPSIGFIGALDWIPNQEGLYWFLEKIWPVLRKKYPALTFHIAGRNTPAAISTLEVAGVKVYGEVKDAKAFINQHSIMVVPLLSGSGIRVKILEGMALGRVVITTSIGMEGIHARNGKEIMVADNVNAFINCIDTCIENQAQLKTIGKQARQLILDEFDNLKITTKLIQAYQQLTHKKSKPSPALSTR